jgi:bifunctional UDP-N-acetylglucosamine pyrophosphorylase/glucosamine-1-phosphate N-acetyltransferase
MLDRSVEFRDATPAEREINLCNAGVMVCERALLFTLLREVKADNAQGEYYLPDVIGLARRRHLTCAVIETDETEVLGVNSRAELALVERHMQARLRRMALEGGATLRDPESVYFSSDTRLGRDVVVEQNVVFGPGVTVADNVMIRAFSHLEGVRVEEGAIVGPFARLRPGAEIGRNVHIGNFVEVKNAKIDEGAKANHLTYIGDAHVGAGSNIGAGTITCNYDGFDKHHTEIGANVFIGSNTALVAPVKVGEGAYVGAGSVITKDVTAEALAVERAKQAEVPGWATKFRARKRAEKAAKSKSEKKG